MSEHTIADLPGYEPPKQLSAAEIKARRQIRADFNGLSPAGKFELIRFSYYGLTDNPALNDPLPPVLAAIQGSCDAAEKTYNRGRMSFGFILDRKKMAQDKGLLKGFKEIAAKLPAGHQRADFAILAVDMLAFAGGPLTPEAKLASAARVKRVLPTAKRIIAESYAGFTPAQTLDELHKSRYVNGGYAPVYAPQINPVMLSIVDRVADSADTHMLKRDIAFMRKRLAAPAA